jgi:hypothetical protein
MHPSTHQHHSHPNHATTLTRYAGLILTANRSFAWYSTLRFKTATSLPYTLHGSPARVNTALSPCALCCSCVALYPGQTSCALTASGSLIFEMTSAPTSADAGIVNTERNDVGVPLSVVLQPSDDDVGVCACAATARHDESSAPARTRVARDISGQLNREMLGWAGLRHRQRIALPVIYVCHPFCSCMSPQSTDQHDDAQGPCSAGSSLMHCGSVWGVTRADFAPIGVRG